MDHCIFVISSSSSCSFCFILTIPFLPTVICYLNVVISFHLQTMIKDFNSYFHSLLCMSFWFGYRLKSPSISLAALSCRNFLQFIVFIVRGPSYPSPPSLLLVHPSSPSFIYFLYIPSPFLSYSSLLVQSSVLIDSYLLAVCTLSVSPNRICHQLVCISSRDVFPCILW